MEIHSPDSLGVSQSSARKNAYNLFRKEMWARLVLRGCWPVQTGALPGRTLCWAAEAGTLPARTLCGRCLASLAPAVGGGLASLGESLVTPAVMSQQRPVHTSSVHPKQRWKKKFRKKKTLNAVPPEDAEEEDALDVTSLEEERDRIIYLVQERLKTNRRKRFSGTQHYRPNIVRVVDALQAQRFPSNLIIDIASETDLLERPIAHVAGFVEKFRLEGFPSQSIASILASNPRVVTLQEPEVDQILNALRATLNSKLIQEVVGGNPEVLLTDPKKIISRFQKLTQLFHRSEVVELVGRSPTLLTCGWSEVEEKYWYVTDVMGVDPGQIVKTNLMTHSLQHLETRHTILERAGLYERPNKHGATSIQNATLRQIVDLDDDHFAPLCARMSAREYRTYWRLLELERREAEEEEEELEEEEIEDEDSESLENR